MHGGTGGLQVPGRRQREGRREHLEVAEAGGRASLEGGPAGPGMCPVPGKILSWATVRVAGASLQSLRRPGNVTSLPSSAEAFGAAFPFPAV